MPKVGQTKFIDFKVNCLRDPYCERAMQMRFVFLDNMTWFPAPCNGCEWLSGDDKCIICTARLTTMFFDNPELDITKPITPKETAKE